jgi:hypothetical protein
MTNSLPIEFLASLTHLQHLTTGHLSFHTRTIYASRSGICKKYGTLFTAKSQHLPSQFTNLPLCTITAAVVEKVEKCSGKCAYFDASQLPDLLEISPPLPGERMIPFGGRSEQKIKKLRTDRHIHAETLFPVLRGNGKVLWAVTVRHSALAAVDAATRQIVKFEFEEN